MKRLILILLLIALPCSAKPLTRVERVYGDVLHTIQNVWTIVDETTSAGTEPTALGEDERKKIRLDAAIAAASSGDDEISTFNIPAAWNGLRFRSMNITADSGNVIYELYLGTLGGGLECDLVYAGQLNFTSGDQDSSYYQIAFTLGGVSDANYIPQPGDTVTGESSGETAVVVSISALTGGAWADGDAAGTITYRSSTGAFTNSELIKIDSQGTVKTSVLKHAASDLVLFEWADTLVVTAKSWGAAWSSTSPADDTIAEAELDVKGADFLVILPSTCSADAKLLIRGY